MVPLAALARHFQVMECASLVIADLLRPPSSWFSARILVCLAIVHVVAK